MRTSKDHRLLDQIWKDTESGAIKWRKADHVPSAIDANGIVYVWDGQRDHGIALMIVPVDDTGEDEDGSRYHFTEYKIYFISVDAIGECEVQYELDQWPARRSLYRHIQRFVSGFDSKVESYLAKRTDADKTGKKPG